MIGNAVPPKFSKVIAETVCEIFETVDKTFRMKNGLFEELNEPKLKYATL